MVSPVSLMSSIAGVASDLQTGPGSSAAAQPAAAGASFAEQLGQMAGETVRNLRQGEASAIGALNGTVPAQEAVTQIMQAERQLQHAIAVRDKLVSAYVDLSRMQI